MSKKETSIDFVEVDLMEPIYRTTVVPIKKVKSQTDSMTWKLLSWALMLVSCAVLMLVPLGIIFYTPVSKYFGIYSDSSDPAAVLEMSVTEGNPMS